MLWASAISDAITLDQAIQATCAQLRSQLGSEAPDLVLAFVSGYSIHELDALPRQIEKYLPHKHLLGCTAGGVIGGGEEVERRPALALTAAHLPGVRITDLQLRDASDTIPTAELSENPHFLLLPDPFSFQIDPLLHRLDESFPLACKIGGLASGGRNPGTNRLFVSGQSLDSGLVGLALSGNLEIETLVAQGCRPIGNPMFITRCQNHLLQELDGKPITEVMQKLFATLSERDQELFQHSLFVGIVMKETQREYHQGDFLIRNILGFEQSSGSLAVGTHLHLGQVVQFHLRDAKTSEEDLQALLMRYKTQHLSQGQAEGALLFSCLGRGAQLYRRPNHDSELFQKFLGKISLGGFFCNGEIGPVQGRTYLHGYTSSFGIFRSKAN